MPTTPYFAVIVRRVHVLAIDLEVLMRLLAGVAAIMPLVTLWNISRKASGMSGNQVGSRIGVGIQVIEEAILHHIVALSVGQRVI